MYPELPTPVGVPELLILVTATWEPTVRPWGSSVVTLKVLLAQVASAINLKFLCSLICVSEPDPKYVWISELVAPIEVLDSWIINPSLGGLAIVPPLFAGRTYLTLYVISFVFLLSPFLLI